MLTVRSLTKRYSTQTAVTDTSFSLSPGTVTGLIGPNGAGKTTTMNMITGALVPSEGEILIDGCSLIDDPIRSRRLIGYLPEHPALYDDLTVYEHLSYICALRGISRTDRSKEVLRIMGLTDIIGIRSRLCRFASKGFRQRIGLAAALAGSPPYLILDEPAAGLDPGQIISFIQLISRLREQHAILISSHILSQIETTCDQLIIMHDGKIAASGSAAEIRHTLHHQRVIEVILAIDYAKWTADFATVHMMTILESCPGKEEHTTRIRCSSAEGDVRIILFDLCASARIPILSMIPVSDTLEGLFLQTTASRKENV